MNSLTIYKSSAGSGKTFTLVLEYLKLVIANPHRYKNILAITFTNAATNEMKRRIVERLMELATLKGDALTSNLVYKLLEHHFDQHAPGQKPNIQLQAQKALDLILNDYTNFSISTIERFFQRIVRAFTRELNIPIGYEVEMRQHQVLEQVITDMLLVVGKESSLTQLLKQFLDFNLSENKSWNVHLMLKNLGQQVFKEQFQQLNVKTPLNQSHIKIIQDTAKELLSIRRQFEGYMLSQAEKAIDILNREGLSLNDFKYKSRGSVPSFFYRVRDKKDFEPKTRQREGCEKMDLWMAADADRITSFDNAIQQGLIDILAQMIDYYDSHITDYQTAVSVSSSIYSFGVMYDIQQKLAQYRQENHQLIISDTSFLLGLILQGGTDPPFIYERVGTRYFHYLLDEFQDTSDMQWDNLFPLLKEAMSQGLYDSLPFNLIVGDVKQSIYRWRNGNMDLLNYKVERQMYQTFGELPQEEHLTSNWRSAKDLVTFNNIFFEHAVTNIAQELAQDQDTGIHQAYRNIEQESKKDIRGFTGVLFLEHESSYQNPHALSWKDRAEGKTLELIHQLLEEGFRECDITLLVRRNSEGVRLAQFLQKHDIKVVSAESLLLMRNSKVILIHAFLTYLVYDEDEVARATLKYYLHQFMDVGKTEHTTFAAHGDDPLLAEIISQRDRLLRMSVYDCVSFFIHHFSWLYTPDTYVLSFLGAVLEYTQLNDSSIIGFLEWWEDQKNSRAIASTDEQDAVRIMTIHKSKGLEFPVVIIPFADWQLKPKTGDFIWIPQPEREPYDKFDYLPVKISSKLDLSHFQMRYQEEVLASYTDNLNLLYVGFTRPQHRLYILTRDFDKEIKNITQVAHIINRVIKVDMNMEAIDEQLWGFGETVPYVIPENEKEQEMLDLVTLEHIGKDYKPDISIRFSSNMYLPTDIRLRSQQILAGELIHEAMAYMHISTDITKAVQHVLHKGLISTEETEFLEELIQEVVLHPDAAHWYTDIWEIKNEAEILHEDGAVLRPDRVMIQENKAVVVDYKTGDPYSSHHIQVQKYMFALRNMGYEEVEGYVYYLLQHVERVEG